MIKLKHFHYIDGSGPDKTETNFLKEVEGFVNQDTINVMEMNHTFTHAPQKMLSVFVSYVEIEKKVKDVIKEGVDKAEKAKKPKKTTKKGKK